MENAENKEGQSAIPEQTPVVPGPPTEPPKDDGYKVGPGCPPKEHQFKPGQSGNPKGGQVGKRWTTMMRELAELEISGIDPQTGQTRAMTMGELAILAQFKAACKGNTRAFRELMDRIEGKVPQPLTGADGAPLLPGVPLTVIVEGVDGAERPPDAPG